MKRISPLKPWGMPVGAVLVGQDGNILAHRNQMRALNDPTAHAEILPFAKHAKNWAMNGLRAAAFM